jgi:hypothetical protein
MELEQQGLKWETGTQPRVPKWVVWEQLSQWEA